VSASPGLRSLSETFEAMRATRSPRMKEALLGDFLLSVADDATALQMTARVCSGRGLAPGDPRNVGVGWSLVMEVASGMTGYPPGILAACARATGDLGEAIGLLVERSPGAEDRPGLTLSEVAVLWDRLAATARRTDKGPILFRALASCTPLETKYLLRSLGGGLRVGAQETLVLAAIARAFDRDIESVRWAFARTGDVGVVACLARDDRLAQATFEIGRPAAFMLATPLESVRTPLAPELLVIEDKIDGIRAQAHKRGSEVVLFARGLSRVTEQFPEVAAAMKTGPACGAIDGEIVAIGPEGRPRPFHVLAERIHRKAPTRAMLARVPVAFVAYDLLADDDGDALDRPWTERRARLERFVATLGPSAIVTINPARPMDVTPGDPSADPAALPASVREAFQAARERGHEGLVLKRTDALYEAGRRTSSWIKVKQAFATLDCVITAAEEGHGKRAGVWSDYTFAVWSGAELLNIGKAYSGLTDAEIESLTARLRKLAQERYGRAHVVRPEVVLEIAFDGVQRSARHKSGFALRFPRIVRLRDDKLPEQADSLAAVRAIFAAQIESGHREEPRPAEPPPDEAPSASALTPGASTPPLSKRPPGRRRPKPVPTAQLAFPFAHDAPESGKTSR
jgi:DNA ligase-1